MFFFIKPYLCFFLKYVAETSLRRAAIDKALLDMIVTDLQPVSIVEDAGFQNFVKILNPKYRKYRAPSRRTIMREHLPCLYQSKKEELMETIANIKWCSFTTDLWSSRTTMGFLTMTGHFITKDWEMKSAVLETCHIPESHTSINLASQLKNTSDNKFSKKIINM